ncbi:hypothetical protein BGZ47_004606 [Haplosporangium gracile]|nr:hypothetical protein BGZ47_004606 [Haplosporangium gracile]
MGATCLIHWKDANGQQSLTLLSDRLLKQFHASNIGRWNINWKVFRDTSPVSKSGTGKMMHVVHVQGGATARGVPPNAKAASLYAGSFVASNANSGVGGVGLGAGGPGAARGVGIGGPGVGGQGGVSGPQGPGGNNAGPGKTGLGIMSSVVGVGAGGSGGPGGVAGSGQGLASAETLTAWCLIDDGAVGIAPTATTISSATPSVASTPINGGGGAGDVPPKKRAVLVEVEKDIEALIAKLKNLWVHRQHAQVEGYVYDLGDFIVRAGNIMVASTSYKGMLIEIEYLPQTSSATASNALLEEFVRLISPPGVNLYSPQMFDYPYEQVGLDPKNWSMLHSGFQFMTLFRRQHIL